MNMSRLFYVYVDYTDDGVPFYVGKGTERRLNDMKRNDKHTWVCKKYGQNRVIVFSDFNEKWVLFQEHVLIKQLHTFNSNIGDHADISCNLTLGGEGNSGWKPTKETRQKNAQSHKGKKASIETRHKMSNSWYRHGISEETRVKMRLGLQEAYKNDEYRHKLSNSLSGKKRTAEQRMMMKETALRISKDPEHLQRLSEAQRKRYERPDAVSLETREKISKANLGKKRSEETRRKISEKAKNRSEETHQRMSEAQRRRYEDPKERDKHRISPSIETRQKLRELRKGKVASEESRQRMSEAQKKRFEERPVSHEAREKISRAHKGRTFSDDHRRKLSEKAKLRWEKVKSLRDENNRINDGDDSIVSLGKAQSVQSSNDTHCDTLICEFSSSNTDIRDRAVSVDDESHCDSTL